MNLKDIMTIGAIVISCLAMIAFAAALVMAYVYRDQQDINLLVGVVATNATTAVGFWVGSSAGSQKKDQTIAAQAEKK